MAHIKDVSESVLLRFDRKFDGWAERHFPRVHSKFRWLTGELSAMHPRSLRIAVIVAIVIFALSWWIEA